MKKLLNAILLAIVWLLFGFLPLILVKASGNTSFEGIEFLLYIVLPVFGAVLAFLSVRSYWLSNTDSDIPKSLPVSGILKSNATLHDLKVFFSLQPESNWCGFIRTNGDTGQHCALGFIDVALSLPEYDNSSVSFINNLIPDSHTPCSLKLVEINNEAAREGRNIKQAVLDYLEDEITTQVRAAAL